jgi:ribose transport system ATP-binding protein
MGVLEAKGITKRFPGVKALDKVDLLLNKGEIHCIVGENGAGKSTLVRILTGLLSPDEGTLTINGRHTDSRSEKLFATVAYVPQELNLFRHMTVAENLFLPFDKTDFSSFVVNDRKIAEFTIPFLKKLSMTVSPSDVVAHIPVSDQQLLQVARAIARQHFDVLILDEPTTSLTQQETERFFNIVKTLRDEGKSIVFISHKLDEVFALGDSISVLRNGQMVGFSPQINDVDPAWAIQKMSGEEIDVTKNYRPAVPPGDLLLEVKNLCGKGFSDISFAIRRGEILGFAGLVGAGRSEIMQTVFGYLPEKSGEVYFKNKKMKFKDTNVSIKNGIVYLTEERKTHGVFPFLSVRENINILQADKIATLGILNRRADNMTAKKVIKEYNIKTTSQETKIINLSGGNQQKVLIGRTMEASPQVIIFDEPTKGIDVKTKEEIYSMMKRLAEEKGIGVILISSEMEELMKCANRMIAIYNGRKVGEFEGDNINTKNILSYIIGAKTESDK